MKALANCWRCDGDVHWISCPTGGWWAHLEHPADDHDAMAPEPINEEDWL